MNKISAEIKKDYNKVIVLDEQGIRRLHDEIAKQIDKEKKDYVINLKIKYSNNSSIETSDLEYITKEENINGKKIVGISFNGQGEDKTISISFGNYYINKNRYEGVSLRITGPDQQWIYLTKSIIEERIKSFENSKLRHDTVICISFFAIIIVTYLSLPYLRSQFPIEFIFEKDQEGDVGTISVFIGMAYLFISLLLSVSMGNLFPNITFSIGKGIERYKNKLKTRLNIFWGLLITTAISIIINIIF